jgi:hypothetical protein
MQVYELCYDDVCVAAQCRAAMLLSHACHAELTRSPLERQYMAQQQQTDNEHGKARNKVVGDFHKEA